MKLDLSKYAPYLSPESIHLLESSFDKIGELLPHFVLKNFQVRETKSVDVDLMDGQYIGWNDVYKKTKLNFKLQIRGINDLVISGTYSRATVDQTRRGYKEIRIADEERTLIELSIRRIRHIFEKRGGGNASSLGILMDKWNDVIVSMYIRETYKVEFDMAELFTTLQRFSEISYENKSLTYGIIIDCKNKEQSDQQFPRDFQDIKRYRALSDGYNTAFKVSRYGKLIEFVDISDWRGRGKSSYRYTPKWCEEFAGTSNANTIAVNLALP